MRDFNLHSVVRVGWQGYLYPVISPAGKDSLWIQVPSGNPTPHNATASKLKKGIVLVRAAGLVLHRNQQGSHVA